MKTLGKGSTEPRRANDRSPARRRGILAGGPIVLLLLILLSPGSSGLVPTSSGHSVLGAGPSAGAPASVAGALTRSVGASPAATPRAVAATPKPATSAFNPNCYPIPNNITAACVSIQLPGEPDIVPNGTSRVAAIQPACNQSFPLVIKMHDPINYSGNPISGPFSPIMLNVTSVTWNGDPYYSQYSYSIWHSQSPSQLYVQLPEQTQDKTYPWWYLVNITSTTGGQPTLQPGMQVTWWIHLLFKRSSSSFQPADGPKLQFTCSGAWPYSPYPGSPHFGGPASIGLDTAISLSPREPNWNDSVFVTINTTQADVSPYNATVGAASIDIEEVVHGFVVANTSWSFNVTVTAGFGNTTTTTRIPATYAQIQGATIDYRLHVSDTSPEEDWLVSPWLNYSVNGNGSFPTGAFTSDLSLTTSPSSVAIDNYGTVSLAPGAPLGVTLISRDPTDAILAAVVLYSVAYPTLHETIHESLSLNRSSSIHFFGQIPALPLGTIVNFTVFAWDFEDAVEVSNPYSYSIESLAVYNGPIDPALAFFYVYVYDNGTGTWVSGAQVQIQGPQGELNSLSRTTLGLAYPNQTGTPFVPLLVESNVTYNITVTDNAFLPAHAQAPGPISVYVRASNPMTATQPLASTSDYIVLQEGDSILFYLNGTAPPTPSSPSVASQSPLGALGVAAVIGLVGATACAVPILLWWRQIKARRTAEEKRVTL